MPTPTLTPSSWRVTVSADTRDSPSDAGSPSDEREQAPPKGSQHSLGGQVPEVSEPERSISGGSGESFYSSEGSAVEELPDEELKEYRNLDRLTPKSVELPRMDDNDDPLSTALQYIRMQRELLKSGDPAVVEEESKMKAWVDMEELEMLLQEELAQRLVRKWVYFDLVFGVIILANGIMLGLSTQGFVDEDSAVASIIELIFVVIFIFEWCYRWRYKKTGLRGMLTDKWTLFDFCVICVTVFDVVILGALQIESGASMLTALRVIRLFRLVRLVRLFKLLKKLWMIVSGMQESLRILFWSIVMMSLFCYVFGLFALEIARSNETAMQDAEKELYWGSVTASVLSMAELATHNGERPLTHMGEISLWNVPLAVIFLFSTSLGLLNLVIAVQMTSSLHLAKKDDLYDSIIDRLIKHRSLRRLREMLSAHCLAHGGSTAIHREQLVDLSNTPAEDEDPKLDAEASATTPTPPSPSVRGSGTPGTRGSRTPGASRSTDKSNFFKTSLVKSRDVSRVSLSATVTQFGEYIRGDRSSRPSGFQLDFESAGISEVDINIIFNEIDAINGFAKPMAVDDFIGCCMMLKNNTRPIDLVSWTRSICAVYSRLVLLNSATTDTTRALDEASEQVRALLKKYHTTNAAKDSPREDLLDLEGEEVPGEAMETASRDDQEKEEAEKRRMMFRDEQEAVLNSQENTHILIRNNWTRFDLAFSVVVFSNTIILGFEAATDPNNVRDVRSKKFDTLSMAWFVVEFTFLLIYLVEFVLRSIFHYQMEVQGDYRMIHGFCPKLASVMDRRIACLVLYSTPRWLKKFRTFMLLDFLLILTGMLDNIILRLIYTDSDETQSYSRALKLVGLLRLLRGLRLLRLVRPLRSLMRAFLINTKIIFWSFMILIAVIYAGAIAMVQLVGREDGVNEATQRKWSHLGAAMSILSEMVTFANWEQHLAEIAPFGVALWLSLAVFLVVSSLGVLNFVTGVMVQVAFSTVLNVNTLHEETKLADGKVWIQEAISRAFASDIKRREADKAELQSRVAEMRQEVLRKELSNQADSETRAGNVATMLSPQARLRRSRQQSVTSEEIVGRATAGALLDEQVEDASGVRRDQTQSKPRSALNEGTYCIVSGAFWMAERELCVCITAVEDLRRSSASHDPMNAALLWDNGRSSPLFYAPDHAAMEEVSKHQRHADDGGARDSSASPRLPGRHRRGKTSHHIGNLFFGKVPVAEDLFFQFGPNHTKTRVFPVKSNKTWEEQIPLIDVVPLDTEVLTIRELRILMQDPVFNKRLAHINLGAEQVLLSYATINVNCTGKVKVTDFIEGLMRLRRQDLGLDTAAAKSLFRRTILEAGELSKEALMCHMCFSSMVQRLHGINLIEQAEHEDTLVLDEEEEAVEVRQTRLAADNQSFRRKLSRLKEFVEKKKAEIGGPCNLIGFGRITDDDDARSSHHSITSASPGWD